MMGIINLLIIMPAISFFVMIYGWGLTPQSWPVIIGGYILIIFITVICKIMDDAS